MKKGLVTVVVIAILLGSAGVAFWLLSTKPEARKRGTEISKLGVKAYKESKDTYTLKATYPAKVRAQEVVALGVEVGGKIEKGDIPLKKGQTFKKGDLLFSINNNDINTKLISAKSKLITTLSQILPDIQIDFKSEYNKWLSLFENISFDNALPPLPKINSSKERVYLASKGIITDYYSIDALEILADKHSIYSPLNGVFTDVTKEVGAIANANSQLGEIASTDNLEVTASITEADANRVKIGDKAVVIARDSKEFTGTISRISSFLEDKTRMVSLYITLYEPTRAIIAGEMLNVVIPLGEIENVIKLPFDAIGINDRIYGVSEDSRVYFIDDAQVEYVDGEWAYVSNLQSGQLIIQESLVTPIEGAEVNVLSQHIE